MNNIPTDITTNYNGVNMNALITNQSVKLNKEDLSIHETTLNKIYTIARVHFQEKKPTTLMDHIFYNVIRGKSFFLGVEKIKKEKLEYIKYYVPSNESSRTLSQIVQSGTEISYLLNELIQGGIPKETLATFYKKIAITFNDNL